MTKKVSLFFSMLLLSTLFYSSAMEEKHHVEQSSHHAAPRNQRRHQRRDRKRQQDREQKIVHYQKILNEALWKAALIGDLEETTLLLKEGASAIGNPQEKQPLYSAACAGNLDITKLLIDNNADIHQPTGSLNELPLHGATNHGQLEVVNYLLASKADVNAPDKYGVTALHGALITEKPDMALHLLNVHQAKVQTCDDHKVTPLHCAATLQNPSCCEQLLQANADPNALDHEGNTPLHNAARALCIDTYNHLAGNNADTTLKNLQGITPAELMQNSLDERLCAVIHSAYPGEGHRSDAEIRRERDALEKVKVLVTLGASINRSQQDATQPLARAAEDGLDDIVAWLLENNADVDRQSGENRETPLIVAAKLHRSMSAWCLLQRHARIEAVDINGNTALMAAALHQRAEMVDSLLDNNANPDARNNFNQSAAWLALSKNGKKTTAMLKSLLARGIDPHVYDNEKEISLLQLAAQKNIDACKLLLEAKAPVEHVDKEGNTALHYAARRAKIDRSFDTYRFLKARANIHAINNAGQTPEKYLIDEA